MPDPIIADTPFGETPAWPPSPARLDRELDAQNNAIINVDWSLDKINLTTDIQGKLPYANIQDVTAQRLLGRDSGTGVVQEIIIGSNLTLSGGTLAAQAGGGGGLGDFSTNTSVSVVGEIVLFSNTGGKQGKRSTGSGICQLTSGVLSVGGVPTSQLSGTLLAAQFPALTGAVTTSAGSLATTIAAGAVSDSMLAGGITAAHLVGSDISTVGTVTAGNWAATPIPIAYGGTGTSSVASARAALGIEVATPVGDADYPVLSSDRTVSLTAALTAVRTWTLPQASTVNDGTTIRITDSVAGVTGTNYVQIAPFAGDTISGSTNAFILNKAYGLITITKSKSTGWVVLSTTSIVRRFFGSNQTYTTPVGIKALFVEVLGAGGAGGGAALASSNLSLGAGGGGGGYSSVYIASPVASYLITVGVGGTGVSGGTGNAGTNTTFGAVAQGNGGAGGAVLAAGTALATIAGPAGGSGGIGDVNVNAGFGGAGIRLSASVGIAGAGGASAFGFGGPSQQVISTNTGFAGSQFGGGGGGALTTAAAQAGGSGSQGLCLVTEYY